MKISEIENMEMSKGLAYALGLIYPLYKEKQLENKTYLLGCVNHNSGKVSQGELAEHYNSVYRLFSDCGINQLIIIKANKNTKYSLSSKDGFSILIEITDINKEKCIEILTNAIEEIKNSDDGIRKEFVKGCFDGRASWDKTAHYLSVDVDRDYNRQELIEKIISSVSIQVNINRRDKNHKKNDQIRIKTESIDYFISNIGLYSSCRMKLIKEGRKNI